MNAQTGTGEDQHAREIGPKGMPRRGELVDDGADPDGVPHEDRIREQADAETLFKSRANQRLHRAARRCLRLRRLRKKVSVRCP
jgi:hypothetical protein